MQINTFEHLYNRSRANCSISWTKQFEADLPLVDLGPDETRYIT